MRKVLILTYGEDLHADSVSKYFDKNNVEYFRVNTESLVGKYEVTYNSEESCYFISNGVENIKIDNTWKIWNRRVMNPDIEKGLPKTVSTMIFEETERTWDGLLFSHSGKIINRPQNHFYANNKIDQLFYAKKNSFGIIIPDTIVSNSPKVVEQFFIKHKGNICFKLQKGVIIERNNEYQTVYTNKVKKEDLKNLELVKTNPCLFQEYIDKRYEIRIIATESEQVGIAIYSQNSEISSIDFRRYDFENVHYSKIDLPRNVKEFCLNMIKHYHLHFGVFDFIYSKNNEYVFLELNPNGQWLWLELQSKFNLTKVVADNIISN